MIRGNIKAMTIGRKQRELTARERKEVDFADKIQDQTACDC
jgi:hypothetical protein